MIIIKYFITALGLFEPCIIHNQSWKESLGFLEQDSLYQTQGKQTCPTRLTARSPLVLEPEPNPKAKA